MPARSLKREVEELVLEQIHTFNQSDTMNDEDLLEFHLRHCLIMALFREIDRIARAKDSPRKGWLS